MKIDMNVITEVEKALNIKLYEGQVKYLLNKSGYWFGERRTGKTLAYCIKLALSECEIINISNPIEFSDYHLGTMTGKIQYSLWFKEEFLNVWLTLKDAGLPVVSLKTKGGEILHGKTKQRRFETDQSNHKQTV